MALATKCPHCNTVFRVAHDQLKLRGGIVRCGACNEVFDGNAALLEPPAPPPVTSPLPEPTPFDQKMAALDTRAAEALSAPEAEPALDLDSPPVIPAQAGTDTSPPPELSMDSRLRENDDESAAPFPLPAAPAIPPVDTEALFDLDLDMDTEPELESTIEHEPSAEHALEALNVDSMSDEELEAALEAELAAMEQTMADVQHDADGQPLADDPFAAFSDGRREPTWDEPPLDEPQAGAGPRLDAAFAAAADAVFSADDAVPAAAPHAGIDADLASFAAGDIDHGAVADADTPPPAAQTPNAAAAPAAPGASTAFDNPAASDALAASAEPPSASPSAPLPSRRSRHDDELDEVDEEALVQLSAAGMSQAQTASALAYLHGDTAEEETPEEPGFVKRARQRQKYGKATTIAMSLGALLLVAALGVQAVTTFRNTLAASVPALKPALSAACTALGCRIELPTQIDSITIEQGELQTLSETTFSFTTLLRNQSATAQTWPSIELVLDDDKDKHVLRRVFTPRDYLGADTPFDKGFAAHSEQAVKLYFELHDLKASGYHIAVFYP